MVNKFIAHMNINTRILIGRSFGHAYSPLDLFTHFYSSITVGYLPLKQALQIS